jgi:sulfatase maturation enzyme AslB (radical SAM superfamily)
MCLRNFHGGGKNNLLELHDWSLEDFKKRIPKDLLLQLHGFYFCGNLGDPIINDSLISMIEYAVSVNEKLSIRVHTNGGARNENWWKKLANALPDNHLVTFSMDGLEDTHSLYRIGTKFSTVLANAKVFIENNGKAEWCFIKFKHNEHQVEQARSMAIDAGFKKFTLKNSSRFILEPQVRVLDKHGVETHTIEPASDTPLKFVDKKIIIYHCKGESLV